MPRHRVAGVGDVLARLRGRRRVSGLPAGYIHARVGGARAVVRIDAADAVRAALEAGTLYDFAATHPDRRELYGRGAAYAIPLAEGLRIVVRRNRHGGLFASLTRDRFLTPTRAPRELLTAIRLAAAGVPTPPVAAIVRYPAGGPFERADVATDEIPQALDLAHVLRLQPESHAEAAVATGQLLAALAKARARHADLNIKNVLLQRHEGIYRAFVLDVDRVTFHGSRSRDVHQLNLTRFERSATTWRIPGVEPIPEAWITAVRHAAAAAMDR